MWRKNSKQQYRGSRPRSLVLESLEARKLLCSNVAPAVSGEPTECEQYMLELVNLARSDGAAEATRNSLAGGLQEGPPTINGQTWTIENTVQPLAWNKSLKNAALAHATALNNADQFYLAGSNPHTFGGTTPDERITAAGYVSGTYSGPTNSGFRPGGENISEQVRFPVTGYSAAELEAAMLTSHVGLFNDTTVPGRGHRSTMMLGAFKEFGVGVSVGTDNSNSPGNPPANRDSIYMVHEFGIPAAGLNFVTGVVYNDTDNSLNNQAERMGYTPGEGLGNVTITATPTGGGAASTTTTFATGGYSLQLADGTYQLVASGGFGTTDATTVVISGANQKVDFVNPAPGGISYVDNGDMSFSTVGGWGSWNQAGHLGDYQYAAPQSGNSATWTFTVTPGNYKVSATWAAQANHATNAPFTILDGSAQIGSVTVDQSSAPNDFTDASSAWENLGVFAVSGTTLNVTLSGAANNFVIADAIRLQRLEDVQLRDNGDTQFATAGGWGVWNQAGHAGDYQYAAPNSGNSATWTFDVLPGIYKVSATWIAQANHATNAPFTVLNGNSQIGAVTLNQTASPNDFSESQSNWEVLGVFETTGITLNVTLSDTADNFVIADAIRIERLPDAQVKDNGDSGFSSIGGWGFWNQSGHAGDYQYAAANAGSSATWSFDILAGNYKVSATWIAHGNHATNAPFTVLNGNMQVGSVMLNQSSAPDDFVDLQSSWENLGVFTVNGNSLNVTLVATANNFVIADAIRIERLTDVQIRDNGDSGFVTVGGWGSWNQAGHLGDYQYAAPNSGNSATWTFDVLPGTYKVSATWIGQANHAVNAPYTIFDGNSQVGNVPINQTAAPNDFSDAQSNWEDLGMFVVSGTTLRVTLSDTTNNFIIADAIRIERMP